LYMEASEYEKAVKAYSIIITRNDPNGYIPYALQKRALAYSNLKNYSEAKEDYKTILSRYAQHPVGLSALNGLQDLLALEGSSDQFDVYINEYKAANPDQKGLTEIEYNNALVQYSNQRYEQSAKNFDQFINRYPEHPQTGEAIYYLAESNYRLKKYEEATTSYERVLKNKDKFYNRSLNRLADIANLQSNSPKAVEYYSQLNQYASNKKELFVAWTGLMENYFKLDQQDSTERYADLILNNGNPLVDAQNKALLYKAKVYQKRSKYVEATDYLVQLMNNNKDIYAAEANYILAEIQYAQKEYQQSLETLYTLNENYATYTDWVNKAYLLIAENLVATEETFQAKATLQSIIDHCKDPAVVEKAKVRLDQLK
jgi:TolA-binding protein